jgi:hypothetical protein
MSNIIIPTRHQAAPSGNSGVTIQESAGSVLVADGSNFTATERTQAKNAMAVLAKHYPGFFWSVEIKGGMMQVTNRNLSGRWGFFIPLAKLSGDYKELVTAGGELLERYRVRRGRADLEKLMHLERDFSNNFVFDKG